MCGTPGPGSGGASPWRSSSQGEQSRAGLAETQPAGGGTEGDELHGQPRVELLPRDAQAPTHSVGEEDWAPTVKAFGEREAGWAGRRARRRPAPPIAPALRPSPRPSPHPSPFAPPFDHCLGEALRDRGCNQISSLVPVGDSPPKGRNGVVVPQIPGRREMFA